MISIIIPVYNEATQLPATLNNLTQLRGDYELIVVDGGSQDNSVEILRQWPGIQLLLSQKAERAAQMNAGTRLAKGNILWFVHADTRVPKDSLDLIQSACHVSGNVGGSFQINFDRQDWPYRLLSYFTRFNSPIWTFGDQGIFVKKNIFDQLGGYPSIPIMEDLDLQWRIRKVGKFIKLPAYATTSARRYHQRGIFCGVLLDMCILSGYFLGVSPKSLNKLNQFIKKKKYEVRCIFRQSKCQRYSRLKSLLRKTRIFRFCRRY